MRPLRLLAWPGMPSGEALEAVRRRLGRDVEVDVIAVNEVLEERVRAGEGHDVVCPSDYMVERLAGSGLLAELDPDRLPGRAHLEAWARCPSYDPDERWCVPLAFGTTGWLHRDDVLPDPEPTWATLLGAGAPTPVGMLEEPREVVAAALLATGASANAADEPALARAAALLAEQAPRVAHASSDEFVAPVLAGDVGVHHGWSGPAAAAARRDRRLRYVLPLEGAVLWTTTASVPAAAPDPEASHALVEALLHPATAAATTAETGFATPNASARGRLPAGVADDPVLFPDAAVLERLEVLRDLPADAAGRVEAVFAAARSRWPAPSTVSTPPDPRTDP